MDPARFLLLILSAASLDDSQLEHALTIERAGCAVLVVSEIAAEEDQDDVRALFGRHRDRVQVHETLHRF